MYKCTYSFIKHLITFSSSIVYIVNSRHLIFFFDITGPSNDFYPRVKLKQKHYKENFFKEYYNIHLGCAKFDPPQTCNQSRISGDQGCVILDVSKIIQTRSLLTPLSANSGGSNLARPSCICLS